MSSTLTLGTMIFGESSDRATQPKEAERLIHAYLDAGGNHLDTADVYAGGRSEEIVGAAVKDRRDAVVIASKVRFRVGDHANAEGLSRRHLMAGVHDSLRRLQTDYLDVLYLHGPDPFTPLEETLRTLEDLVRGGKVRYLGISNFKAWQLMKAQGLTRQLNLSCFVAAQYQYSLVKRDLEYEYADLLPSEGLGLLPWGPLGGGFLTGKYQPEGPEGGRIATTGAGTEEAWTRRNTEQNWRIIAQVREVAATHGVTPSQVAIAWLLSRPMVASVILGVRTMAQLTDNLGAAELSLTPAELATLDAVSQPPELYPYRMIEDYTGRG